MATGGAGPPGATFSIPLVPKGYIYEDHLQELCRHLLKDKAILLQHFNNNDMSFVKPSDATTKIFEQDNKMYICISFEVHNLQELEAFRKHSEERSYNKVSEVFGSFIKEKYDKKLLQNLDTKCPFIIQVTKYLYKKQPKTLEVFTQDDSIDKVLRYDNADRRPLAADKHEQSWVKKTFVIVPNFTEKELASVHLLIAKKDYEMRKFNDVYLCELTVPESIEYKYKIDYRSIVGSVVLWVRTYKSSSFKIKDSLIQRDFLYHSRNELKAHLSHIFFLFNTHCDKKELCSEIETVCTEKVEIKNKLQLITDLARDMDGLGIKNLLPIAIVIGNIYKGKEIVSLKLRRDEAITIAEHLRTISFKDLTTSCCGYMPAVCHRLYQIAFPDKSSCVSEIMYFTDFFGDNINLYIDICMGSKDCQMVADGDDVADFVGLFSVIGKCHAKFRYEQYSNHLKRLLMCASLTMIVDALKEDLDKNIQDHIYTALKEHITEAIKVYSVEELYSCWRIIHQNEKAKEEFKSRIEEHVITQLLKLTTFNKQTKKLMAEDNGMFTDKLMQGKLVNSLLSSGHTLPLFIYLHRADKFKEAYALLDAYSYITWLEWTRTQSKGDLAADIFYIMELTDGKENVHDKVVEYFISNVKCNVKELLKLLKTYDSKLSKYKQIEDAFIHMFREVLDKDKRNPLELLQSMMGTGDMLQVNSRCAVRIIATVLEVLCPLKEDTDDISSLSIVMQHIKVWPIIFTCTGGRQHDLYGDPTCVAAHKFFRRIVNMTEDESLTYALSEKVLSFQNGDIETLNIMLQMFSTSNTLSIKAASEQTISRFQEEEKKLQCVINVLQSILKNNHEMLFPCRFDEVLSAKEVQLKNLPHLNLSEKNCNDLWRDTGSLYHLCSELETATQSVVFWNVNNADSLNEIFTDTDVLSTKYSLSAEVSAGIGELIDPGLRDVNMFLKSLLDVGLYKYKTAWKALDDDYPLSIGNIKTIFRNALDDASLKNEESLVKQIASLQLDQTVDLPKLLINPYSILTESQIIALAVRTFGLENEKFKQKVNEVGAGFVQDSLSKRFHDVKCGLRLMFNLKQRLSVETFKILWQIVSAGFLINFLREIVDDDIRILIDAVDDISEQYVLESTVSGLIEVKSFMQPLIQSKNAEEFLSVVEVRTKSFGQQKCKRLISNLIECKANLHQLKSLYKNVANRGELTKETIQRILSEGQFAFTLSEEVPNVSITCHCKGNNSVHSEPNLVDLRSRSLLLMNSERAKEDNYCSREDLLRFVEYVDLSLEIKQLVTDLFNAGHMVYFTFTATRQGDDLLNLRNKLHADLQSWLKNLEDNRHIHFLLNFIQGIQIHYFSQYIANGLFEQKIEMILKFIFPLFSKKDWKKHYDLLDPGHQPNVPEFLKNLGRSLQLAYDDNKHLFKHQMLYYEIKSNIPESVQKGRFLLANLHENSVNVVKTVLALYENTTKCLPEPFQVLFCCKDTTWEEIHLLIERCLNSKKFFQEDILYCLANVELLPNETQFRLVGALHSLPEGGHYLLSVVCRGGKKHLFIDEFTDYVTTVSPCSDSRTENIFKSKYPDVLTISSEVAGLGKSNYIKCLSHAIKHRVITLHISGKVNKLLLIQSLNQFGLRPYHSLHIDIANVDDIISLDTFLFELVCLRYVTTGTESYNLNTESIYIEVANTSNDKLRNSLQTAMCFKRQHLKWENFENFVASTELNSPTQVVCLFLDALEKSRLDGNDIILTGTKANKTISANRCQTLLAKYVSFDDNLSFVTVNSFLRVFADQLKKLSCSSFFKTTSQIEVMAGKEAQIKSEFVKRLMDVSKEFATRSIKACNDTQQSTAKAESPIGSMIRFEDSNHLIYVFHSQNIQTLTAMYRHKSEVPDDVKCLFERQMGKELQDYNQMNQEQLQEILQRVSRTNPLMLKSDLLKTMSSDYAMTPDNLLKMVLIVMRIRARVPVVVMGETGCGKTSLIRYLARICEVPFDVMNIHAGTSMSEIVSKIEENDRAATKCLKKERWLFLDEINTSENLHLISNIICHHTLNGKTLSPNLVILSACNPYKVRSEEAIYTAGLKAKVKTDEKSKLVYRVLPLPQQLVDYVWDFGILSKQDERKYIHRMVNDVFPERNRLHETFVDILSMSQELVRNTEASYNVSLRDVQRCRKLTKWFCETPYAMKSNCGNEELRAIILGVAHCYISRLASRENRKIFREKMEQVFRKHKVTSFGSNDIDKVIVNEQKRFLSIMELPSGTAQNHALQENVFMILVCILNRIPIFIVGKPGCSKSLAMQVIRSNLRGKDSKDEFFKKLPQIYCVSFQGSESSTSDGILKVFEKAEIYQQNNEEDVLSVVVLDEVGLAEVSRFNPLKVLHSLLEPGDSNFPNIAVVGISNWALDASKMNRAIHLSRPDMTADELYYTGISISQIFQNIDPGQKKHNDASQMIYKLLKAMADAYSDYSRNLVFKNFHGLRDYYALIKYVANKVGLSKSGVCVKSIVQRGLERNFGGLPSEKSKLYDFFKQKLEEEFNNISSEVKEIFGIADTIDFTRDQMPVQEIISENIKDATARHLLLITSGQSIFGILDEIYGQQKYEVMFGSHFEEDLTDDYNYRMLSRIILCMEEGGLLILKDLDTIYGSLYDMLNQNYTIIAQRKNCRIALGHYSNPICRVDDTFRCIVLVDETKLNYQDPPFLNRFEKQMLRFRDILGKQQKEVIQKLECWIKQLSVINEERFDESDLFPIYSTDLLASLVMKLDRADQYDIVGKCKSELVWIMQPDAVLRFSKIEDPGMRAEAESIKTSYFEMPIHGGLEELHLWDCKENKKDNLMRIIFTYTSVHTNVLQKLKSDEIQVEDIGAFKSEKQLFRRMHQFWIKSRSSLLYMQCSVKGNGRHLMHVMTIIERFRKKFIENKLTKRKHVYLILHMSRVKETSLVVSHINFLSSWRLTTIDCLDSPKVRLPELCRLSLLDRLKAMRPYTDQITQQLFWVFTRIKYSPNARNIESIRQIIDKMKSSETCLQMLEKYLWSIMTSSETDSKDWQLQVACDRQMLHTTTGMVDALETYLYNQIRIPLAKVIYKLEVLGALDSFLVDDCDTSPRQYMWVKMMQDDNVFNILNVPKSSGPECYDCNTPDLCYKTPFFKYIHEYLEGEIKRDFTKFIYLLNERLKEENENETPTEDMMEEVKRLQHKKIESYLAMMGNTFTNLCNDYVDDFCNTLAASYNFFSERNRVQITRKLLLQKAHVNIDDFTQSVLNIHASVWINPILISTEMQILDICSNIINLDLPDSSHIDGQVGGAKEDTLPEDNSSNEKDHSRCEEPQLFPKDDNALFNSKDEFIGVICKKLLPTSDNITVFHDIITWSGLTGRLLPLMSVVSNESVSLDMLRYCHIIFESLIGPHEMDLELLFKVADEFLESQSFVPESSFQCLMNIVDNAVGAQKSELQRVISDFLINCLFNHSSEGCMTYLYKVILDQKLPDQTCTFLKYLVTLIIQIEAGDIESFIQIIMPEQRDVDSTDQCVKQNILQEETDSSETICPFIKSLNEFLTVLSSQARSSDPFVLLLVDIFEKEYSVILKKLGKVEASSIFLTANNLIRKYRQDHKLNLTYLASVACYKAFLMEAAANEDIKGYSNAINTIFVQGVHGESMFFIKCLRGDYTSPRLLDVLRRLESSIPKLEAMTSSDEAFKSCYDNSPLGNLVSISGLSQEEADKTLIKKSTTSSEAMLAVYHVILKDFYITRSYSASDDKIKHRAEILLECANRSNFPKCNMKLMSCLLGRKDFQVSKFMLTQETTSRECLINITLMSLFAILTSRYDNSNPSVFQLCLFEPDKIADRYLPAFPSNVERNMGGLNACVSCNCGYRICLISREVDMKCLVCSRKLNNMVSSSTTKIIQHNPGLSYSEEMEKCVYFQTCMSPVACSIVLFLLEGCLLGSHALGILSIDQLKSITNISQTDTNILDFKKLERHWNSLRLLLNLEDYNLFVFLQSFIQNQQSSFTSGNNPFRSPDQRCTWENVFSKAANDSTSNCFGIVGKTISDHAKRYNSIHHDFEVSICECDELNDGSELIYFRMSGKPTRENFIAELFLKANQFPVLDLIIQKEDDIKRVKIINDIIQWHMLIVAETSNLFKKQEFLDMTVDKFINSKREKQKVNLREKFKNLCDAFENENKCFGQIEPTSKMSECLILDENSQMFLRLKLLVQIQNDIIEEVMCKVPNCKSLHQFRKSDNQVVVPELPVMQVAERMLIGFKSDIDKLILQQSQCDPRYGHGRKMIYDFEKVEKILISDVITGKVYLKLDVCQLPKVVFSDELYRNISLLIVELSQTIGHETLSSDTVATIRKEHTSNPKMVPTLLEHIGTLLPLLKITQGEPDNTIKEYTEQWKNIMTVDFPSDLLPSENMKLCHIAALYEFLEELNADAIKDGLGRDYRVKLKKPELDGLSKTLNNNSSIAEVLLKVLKRFIHRSLASRDVVCSLHTCISDPLLWPSGTVSKGAIKVGTDQCDLTDLLPPRILVRHICCVLDLLHELETNKQQREDVIKIAKSTERRLVSPDTEKKRRMQKARSAMKR